MGRKRAPEHDWICRRCGCACGPQGTVEGTRHLGGGQGMRACRYPPDPVLRSDYDAEVRAAVAGLRRS